MPAVSIIVPVYNAEKYLSCMLDSILNQSFSDFELLCINDGSTDCSESILRDYVSRDDRLKLISQENQGAAASRNLGLKLARGGYITFVDSDDVLEPQALEIAYHYITINQADLSLSKFRMISDLDVRPKNQNFSVYDIATEVLDNPILNRHLTHMIWGKLYRRDLVEGIQFIEGIIHDDLPFCYEVYARRPKAVFVDCPIYLYRDNPSSITATSKNLRSLKCLSIGFTRIHDVYSHEDLKHEFNAVKQQLIPRILNTQRKRCQRMDDVSSRQEMLRGFAALLHHICRLKMFGWNESVCWTGGLGYWYRSLRLYFLLKKLMKLYPEKVSGR